MSVHGTSPSIFRVYRSEFLSAGRLADVVTDLRNSSLSLEHYDEWDAFRSMSYRYCSGPTLARYYVQDRSLRCGLNIASGCDVAYSREELLRHGERVRSIGYHASLSVHAAPLGIPMPPPNKARNLYFKLARNGEQYWLYLMIAGPYFEHAQALFDNYFQAVGLRDQIRFIERPGGFEMESTSPSLVMHNGGLSNHNLRRGIWGGPTTTDLRTSLDHDTAFQGFLRALELAEQPERISIGFGHLWEQWESGRHKLNAESVPWEHSVLARYRPGFDPLAPRPEAQDDDPLRFPILRGRDGDQIDVLHCSRGACLEFIANKGDRSLNRYIEAAGLDQVVPWTDYEHPQLRWNGRGGLQL